jgi:hypothetical protein
VIKNNEGSGNDGSAQRVDDDKQNCNDDVVCRGQQWDASEVTVGGGFLGGEGTTLCQPQPPRPSEAGTSVAFEHSVSPCDPLSSAFLLPGKDTLSLHRYASV